jgi:hypothetical protein
MIHHPQNTGVHHVHAHQGGQLQQTLLCVPIPNGLKRVITHLGGFKKFSPKLNYQRLVGG